MYTSGGLDVSDVAWMAAGRWRLTSLRMLCAWRKGFAVKDLVPPSFQHPPVWTPHPVFVIPPSRISGIRCRGPALSPALAFTAFLFASTSLLPQLKCHEIQNSPLACTSLHEMGRFGTNSCHEVQKWTSGCTSWQTLTSSTGFLT